MDDYNTIMDRIGKRFVWGDDFLLQKFMSYKKYFDLLTKSLLYVSRSDRFNDTEESYIFIKESISRIHSIADNHMELCSFVSYEDIETPQARIKFLWESAFDFYHPRLMLSDGKGNFFRTEYDTFFGYRGFDSKSAQKVFECDIKLLRENTFITCFCSNMAITEYMTQEYGEIVIRTSRDRLIQSIDVDESTSMANYPVTYFEDDYSNYRDMAFYQEAIYASSLFGCKRKCYVEEEEFRLVFSNTDFNSDIKKNIFVDIDLNKMIDEIIVTNDLDLEKIQKLNSEHGYNFKVSVHKSSS